jgi:hypothetical protein
MAALVFSILSMVGFVAVMVGGWRPDPEAMIGLPFLACAAACLALFRLDYLK